MPESTKDARGETLQAWVRAKLENKRKQMQKKAGAKEASAAEQDQLNKKAETEGAMAKVALQTAIESAGSADQERRWRVTRTHPPQPALRQQSWS